MEKIGGLEQRRYLKKKTEFKKECELDTEGKSVSSQGTE